MLDSFTISYIIFFSYVCVCVFQPNLLRPVIEKKSCRQPSSRRANQPPITLALNWTRDDRTAAALKHDALCVLPPFAGKIRPSEAGLQTVTFFFCSCKDASWLAGLLQHACMSAIRLAAGIYAKSHL